MTFTQLIVNKNVENLIQIKRKHHILKIILCIIILAITISFAKAELTFDGYSLTGYSTKIEAKQRDYRRESLFSLDWFFIDLINLSTNAEDIGTGIDNINLSWIKSVNNNTISGSTDGDNLNLSQHSIEVSAHKIPAGPGSLKIDFNFTHIPTLDTISSTTTGNKIFFPVTDNVAANDFSGANRLFIFINYSFNLGVGINLLYGTGAAATGMTINNENGITSVAANAQGNGYYDLAGYSKYHISVIYGNSFFKELGIEACAWYDNITNENNFGDSIEIRYGAQAKAKFNLSGNFAVQGDLAYTTYTPGDSSEMQDIQSEIKITPAIILTNGSGSGARPEIKFYATYGSVNNSVKDTKIVDTGAVAAVSNAADNSNFLIFGVQGEAWW